MYKLNEIEKFEQEIFESDKELLKVAFKNYIKDIEKKEAKKTIKILFFGTSVLLIVFVLVYHLFAK